MTVYDGNQLPEAPTSVFQMVVSVYYTLFVSVLMAMGAFAVLAAQKNLDKELPGHLYMQLLISKHKNVARGLLAFIPAAYSLAHLYTSSLHNGSLYSASNIFYVAVFGFAARYLGTAFHELVEDSTHMDSIKAVYECLYMLSRCLGRLCQHPAGVEPSLFASMTSEISPVGQDMKHLEQDFAGPAWLSPWGPFNIFLAIAAQDDSRSWAMFFRWLGRNDHEMPVSYVVGSAAVRHNPMRAAAYWRHIAGDPYTVQLQSSYAYWLYSQGTTVRDFTGSFVMGQNIPAKLNMAGYASRELCTTAHTYMCIMSEHFQASLLALPSGPFLVTCWNGNQVDIGVSSSLVQCLLSVDYSSHGLEMACERYVCRKTPACAAFCLPAECVVKSLDTCWQQIFNTNANPTPGLQGAPCSRWWEVDSGYWCGLWLAYLHMVLLGVDILRMYNNRKTFDASKQKCGFFNVFKSGSAAVTLIAALPANQDTLLYADVHNMHDHNLYGVAALLATWLLAHRMEAEGLSVNAVGAGGLVYRVPFFMPPSNSVALGAAGGPNLRDAKLQLETSQPGTPDQEITGLLQSRTELVECHASLPALVHGSKCLSAAEWVQSLLPPLAAAVLVVAVVAVTLATISCSYGVYLVSFAGLFQAFGAWCLLQCLERLPITEDQRTLRRYAHMCSQHTWLLLWPIRKLVPWVLLWVAQGLFYCVVQLETLLWLLLLTFFNFCWVPGLTALLRYGLQQIQAAIYLGHFLRVQLKGVRSGWFGRFWVLLWGQSTGPDPFGAAPGPMPGVGVVGLDPPTGASLENQLFRVKNHAQQVLGLAACGEQEAMHDVGVWRDTPEFVAAPGCPVLSTDTHNLGAAAAAAASIASTSAAAAKAANVRTIDDDLFDPPSSTGVGHQHGSWLKDALVSLRTVKTAARQLFKGRQLKRKGIGLANCFDPATGNKHLYRHRITLGDIALHVFICWSFAFFAACIAQALRYEPYYTTATGMCLGRCHDRVDCQSNLTLGLPMFEGNWNGLHGQPVCPGVGAVVFAENASVYGHQCPAVVPVAAAWEGNPLRSSANSPMWLRVAGLTVSSSTVPSGTTGLNTSMCSATATITFSATGSPVGPGAMVSGVWSLCRSPKSCFDVFSMVVPTDPQGVATFQSPNLSGARWTSCTFVVKEVFGFNLNATSITAASAPFPVPVR